MITSVLTEGLEGVFMEEDMMPTLRGLLSASCMGLICFPLAIAAQEAPAAAEQPSADDASADGLQDIVVTAQKRSESAQAVPIAIAVATGESLTQSAITNLEGMSVRIPGLRVSEAAAGNQLFIRGVGSGINPAFEQSVGTFIDGTYFGRGKQSVSKFLDVARVEVLKGPQNVFFGNNAIAGAISVVTRDPGKDADVRGLVMHEFNHNEWLAEAAATVPLTDDVSVRFAGQYNKLDGWIRNVYQDRDEPNQESWQLRGKLKARFTDTTDLLLKVEGSNNKELGNALQMIFCPSPFGPNGTACNGGLASSATTGFEGMYNRYKADGVKGAFVNPAYQADNARHELKQFVASGTLNQDLGSLGSLTSVTSYQWYSDYRNNNDADLTPAPIIVFPRRERYRQLSQEVRIVSPTGRPIEYVVGGYFQKSRLFFQEDFFVNLAGGTDTQTVHHQNERTVSLFGALTWNVTDTIKVIGGARYVSVRKKARHQVNLLSLDGVLPLSSAGVTFVNRNLGFFASPNNNFERTDKDLAPSINVQWRPVSRVMFYASYTEGFKSGGFDASLRSNPANVAAFQDNAAFDPERAKSYEIGVKTTLFNNRLRLNLAAFRSEYGNLQVAIFDGVGGFIVGNAASARAQGIDAEATLLIPQVFGSDELTINGAVAYLDAKYLRYDATQCSAVGRRPDPSTPGTCTLTGQPLLYSPDLSGSVGADYTRDLGDDLKLGLNVTAYMTKSFFVASDNDPIMRQPGYTKLDARLSLRSSSNGWELALLGRNLTNKLTFNQGNDAPLGPLSYFVNMERPRTIALQARYGF